MAKLNCDVKNALSSRACYVRQKHSFVTGYFTDPLVDRSPLACSSGPP